jgi:hypothetical protein
MIKDYCLPERISGLSSTNKKEVGRAVDRLPPHGVEAN